MKAFKTLAGALAVAGLLSFSFSASAQENANRDENGKVVRGAYETNRFGDNWFIGAGAGANAVINGNTEFGFGGVAVDGFVGKWFTPSVGARVAYRGLQNAAYAETGSSRFGDDRFTQHFYHADLLWNISNAFSGYKETRFWDLIPYAQFGLIDLRQSGSHVDYEFGAGAGLINDFRLGNRVDLYLDLSAVLAADKMLGVPNDGNKCLLPSVTAGVIVNLGRTNFSRHSSVTPVVVPVPFTVDQYNALKDRVAALEKENASLKDEIERLKNQKPETVYVQCEAVESASYTFFDIDSYTISDREKLHLDFYADAVASKLGDDQSLVITGSADSATGTAAVNERIAQRRAQAVKDYLVKKGVPAEKMEIVVLGGIAGKKDARRVVVDVK
ncbi:MAG: OmpA family protein [Bacteroidales bacterium]|nr:OmpA family protein [Bacteroidales bacterium]MDD6052606.1 OmpA family protein [Bacteroidales bacterium]